jgi:hypothetical protein
MDHLRRGEEEGEAHWIEGRAWIGSLFQGVICAGAAFDFALRVVQQVSRV